MAIVELPCRIRGSRMVSLATGSGFWDSATGGQQQLGCGSHIVHPMQPALPGLLGSLVGKLRNEF